MAMKLKVGGNHLICNEKGMGDVRTQSSICPSSTSAVYSRVSGGSRKDQSALEWAIEGPCGRARFAGQDRLHLEGSDDGR